MTTIHVVDAGLVLGLWWVAVALAVFVIVPVAVGLLHRTYVMSRNIRRYAEDSLEAAGGILENVRAIEALAATVETAGPLVAAGGRLRAKADAVADALTTRRRS